MKLDMYKRLLSQAIGVLCALQLTGCDNKPKDEHKYMTQCISIPAANSQSKMFETKITGNKVSCHALLWRIPEKYSPNHGKNSDFNEYISERILIDKPPENVLPLWKARKNYEDNPIVLERYWENPGESLMTSHKKISIGVFALEKVEENLNGWEVYDCKDKCDVQMTVYSKTKPNEYNLECGHRGLEITYKNMPENAVCHVETYVDGRVYAKYTVLYENIGEMDEINNAVIRFVKSLMLN